MYENLLVEKHERMAVLTVNRPNKLNALNIATRNEILAALDALQSDAEVRVLVITGAGDKAFIAGADIGEFAGQTALSQREVMTQRRAFDAMEAFPKPVIAMINGFCLGGWNWLCRATSGWPANRRSWDSPKSIWESFPAAAERSA